MHIELIEGYFYTIIIECSFDIFSVVEEYRPVILRSAPEPYDKNNTAVPEFLNMDAVRSVFKYPVIIFIYLCNNLLCFFKILLVGDRNRYFNSSCFHGKMIYHGIGGKL